MSDKGNRTRVYVHSVKCYDEYLADKEFKKKEAEELDFLHETIKKVHRIPIIPPAFFVMLQDLRNGTVRVGTKTKKYKEGVSYRTIADTYLYIQNSVDWAKTNRKFDGTMKELRYCFVIMLDKIYLVDKKQKKERFAKEISQSKNEHNQAADLVNFEHREVTFKKKKAKNDISHLLD